MPFYSSGQFLYIFQSVKSGYISCKCACSIFYFCNQSRHNISWRHTVCYNFAFCTNMSSFSTKSDHINELVDQENIYLCLQEWNNQLLCIFYTDPKVMAQLPYNLVQRLRTDMSIYRLSHINLLSIFQKILIIICRVAL